MRRVIDCGAFENRAEERFEAVGVRLGAQVSARVDQRARQTRRGLARVDGDEIRRAGEEGVDDAFVLVRLARTGRVDETAAWRDRVGGVLAACELGGGQRREVAFAAGASGCRDRGAACRVRSRARRRARSRMDA